MDIWLQFSLNIFFQSGEFRWIECVGRVSNMDCYIQLIIFTIYTESFPKMSY